MPKHRHLILVYVLQFKDLLHDLCKYKHLGANNNTSWQYHGEGWLTKLCRRENDNSQHTGNNFVT